MTSVCSPENSAFFLRIVTGCGLGNRGLTTTGSGVYIVVTACNANPFLYPVGSRGCSPESERAGA